MPKITPATFLKIRPSICLNMIVKNESRVIRRCLQSVKNLIDYWVIVDTGSTDGTQKRILESLKGKPGKLYERKWRNFAYNRNQALRYSKGKGDYILTIDADDWIEVEPNVRFTFPTTIDLFAIEEPIEGVINLRTFMFKASLPWKWTGRVHEWLTLPKPYTWALMPHLSYHKSRAGASNRDPLKFHKYVLGLQKDLREKPNDPRTLFYLGASLYLNKKYKKARLYFARCATLRKEPELKFMGLYMLAETNKKLHLPLKEVIQSFSRAHKSRPYRLEPIHALAKLYNEHKQYLKAYTLLKKNIPLSKASETDRLFIQKWLEKHGMLYQLALSSFHTDHFEEAKQAALKLLKDPSIPKVIQSKTKALLKKINSNSRRLS